MLSTSDDGKGTGRPGSECFFNSLYPETVGHHIVRYREYYKESASFIVFDMNLRDEFLGASWPRKMRHGIIKRGFESLTTVFNIPLRFLDLGTFSVFFSDRLYENLRQFRCGKTIELRRL